MAEEDLKNKIILDNGPSSDLFRNPHLIMDTKRSNQVLHLSTNMGSKINQMQAMVLYYGKVWYDDKATEIILFPTNLVKKYRVTYDSHQYYSFTVNTNRGIIQLRRNKQGVYVFNTTYTTETSNFVTTPEENMVGFTSRQIEMEKLARKIYRNVGLTTVKNFNHMVCTSMISNCPISVAYISNSENIYGTSMPSLKGKSTRSKKRLVLKYDIQITR